MTPKKPYAATIAITSSLIGPGIPGAYMAITGHAPMWARIWYCVWFILGCLIVIGRAGRASS